MSSTKKIPLQKKQGEAFIPGGGHIIPEKGHFKKPKKVTGKKLALKKKPKKTQDRSFVKINTRVIM